VIPVCPRCGSKRIGERGPIDIKGVFVGECRDEWHKINGIFLDDIIHGEWDPPRHAAKLDILGIEILNPTTGLYIDEVAWVKEEDIFTLIPQDPNPTPVTFDIELWEPVSVEGK
jgi:hypothetical protein